MIAAVRKVSRTRSAEADEAGVLDEVDRERDSDAKGCP